MFIKREELIDKTVIGIDGNVIGKVSDIMISLQGKVGLAVKTKDGDEIVVEASDISAAGEYILCRLTLVQAKDKYMRTKMAPTAWQHSPTQPAPPQQTGPIQASIGPSCPSCGHVNPPGARFCERCGTRLA